MTDDALGTGEALPELAPPATPGRPLFRLADLGALRLAVEVPLGSLKIGFREILALRPGSVLPLDRLTGESLEITVNGTPVARGEVRVHDERFAVRVTEILRAGVRKAEGEPVESASAPPS